MSPQKIVRCWNCRHLKTVHQGKPKNGRLFSKKVWRCDVHDVKHENFFDVKRKRKCDNHVRLGLWEKPPDVWLPHGHYLDSKTR